MISFKKDIILNDLERFKEHFITDYKINNIEIINYPINDSEVFGYTFSFANVKFKAYLIYKKHNNEYEIPSPNTWKLEINKNEQFEEIDEQFNTIGSFMDKVFELTN